MPILHISQSATAALANPTVPKYPLDGTKPDTLSRDLFRREGFATGVWECTPGKFRRQSPKAEMMHVVAGSCIFTPDDGAAVIIKTGDTVYFPENTEGTWEITETLRKIYAVVG